jgi:hypothetical protein
MPKKPDPLPAAIIALTLITAVGIGQRLHAIGWPPAAIAAYTLLILTAGIAVAILLSDTSLTAAALRPGRITRRVRRQNGDQR